MSILAQLRARGGDVIRDEWRFTLRRGDLTPAAVEWIKRRHRDLCIEAWPQFDAWEERAAIMEFDAGMTRAEAARAAYDEVPKC